MTKTDLILRTQVTQVRAIKKKNPDYSYSHRKYASVIVLCFINLCVQILCALQYWSKISIVFVSKIVSPPSDGKSYECVILVLVQRSEQMFSTERMVKYHKVI